MVNFRNLYFMQKRETAMLSCHEIMNGCGAFIIVMMMFICQASMAVSGELHQRRMISIEPNNTINRDDNSNWKIISREDFKQRKLHIHLPSYEFVGFNGPSKSNEEDFFSNSHNGSTGVKQQSRSSMDYLKKIAQAREKLMKSDSEVEAVSARHGNSTRVMTKPMKKSKPSLEDDRAAIKSLLSVLLEANNQLLEERTKREGRSRSSSKSPIERNGTAGEPDEQKTNRTRTRLDRDEDLTRYESNRLDHMLVKPGFGKAADNLEAGPQLLSNNNIDTDDMNSEAQQHPPVAQSLNLPHPLPYMINEDHGQFVSTHKPIVAKDLLHVNEMHHHQQQNHQRQPEYPSQLMRSNADNLFPPRPLNQQPIVIEHSYHNERAPITTEQPSAIESPYLQAFEQQGPTTQAADVSEHQPNGFLTSPAPHRPPMVPPYNGHPAASMMGWRPHPMIESDAYARPSPPPRTTLHPFATPVGHSGGYEDGAGESTPMSPLQHLLMAARNQQAAAMAYERRRLEHERELEERQENLRKQHEENLTKQRHQQQRALEQQQKQKQIDDSSTTTTNDGGAGGQHDGESNGHAGDSNNSGNGGGDDDSDNEIENNGRQSESEEPNQQQQQENDPDMKGFQEFAGDSGDFTDLFPPGILSEAEIKEMKKQHAEQKQKEQEEENEKQQQQQDSNPETETDQQQDGEPAEQQQQANSADHKQQEQPQQQVAVAAAAASAEQAEPGAPQNQSAVTSAGAQVAHASADKKIAANTTRAALAETTTTTTKTDKRQQQQSATATNYLPKFGQTTRLANDSRVGSVLTQSTEGNNSSSSSSSGSSAMQPEQSESANRRRAVNSASGAITRNKIIDRSHVAAAAADIPDEERRSRAIRVPSASSVELDETAAGAEAAESVANKLRLSDPMLILDLDYRERYIKPFLSAGGYTQPAARRESRSRAWHGAQNKLVARV